MLFRALIAIVLVSGLGATAMAANESISESPRDIPVAYDVDVVVVGGSSGAVAAAAEAAREGASVFLAAPRTYLGDDLCGTYRLWLEPAEEPTGDFEQRLFKEPPAPVWVGEGLSFTYETDLISSGGHQDTDPPTKLCNGKWKTAYNESVEYADDVTITIDLGEPQKMGMIHVLAYQRNGDIELESADVSISTDKQTWTPAASIANEQLGQNEFIDTPLYLTAPLEGTARYVQVVARKTDRVERLLLGEIIVEASGEGASGTHKTDARVPPTPMQVKRTLDQTLLDAGVSFLFGCYPTDVLRDGKGNLAGIVMANRAGRQAVRARVIIDATPRGTVARMAGVSFTRYPAGPQTFTRIVVGGRAPEAEGVAVRTMPSPVQVARTGETGVGFHPAYECTLTLDMEDGAFASFARAEQNARDITWTPGQVGSSEVLFQTPPDAMRAKRRAKGSWPGAASVNLDAFRPAKTSGLYLLGGCADVSRDAAGALLRPLEYVRLGARIGRAAAEDSGAPDKPCVVCFGDSITAAQYPTKLAGMLTGYRVVNAGIGGNTSAQGLARLNQDVLAHGPAAVVVLFGTNDSVVNGPGRYRVPVADYEKNLHAIAAQCADKGARVVFMTPPPIMDKPYFARHPKEHYEPEGGLQAILGRYRAAVKRVAAESHAPIIELDQVLSPSRSVLKECGVHPNAEGERLIAERAAAALTGLLPDTDAGEMQGVHVAAAKGKACVTGDTRELLVGLRSFQRPLDTVPAEAEITPVIAEYDVVVVGGGTGGAPAGIGAARFGAKTLVIEYQHGLGGVGTLGLIGKYYYGYRKGFTAEIDTGVANMGGEEGKPEASWNVEWKMEWLRQALRNAGADIWFGSLGCGAAVDGNRVIGVVVTTPEGRGVILAKTVIDSTGNSDIAAAAGAACIYTDGSHVAVQGTGLPPRQPGANYTNTDYTLTDDGDIVDVWRSFVAARVKYEGAFDLGQVIDTRERRRIVGDFVISPLDIFNRRTYPDSVGLSHSNFDSHGFTIHPLFSLNAPDKTGIDAFTPYRALLPKGFDGILVTGLGISAHRDSMPILRMQPDIQNQGYAAGRAAAMAARDGVATRAINIKALQHHLVEIDCLPESVLTDKDSFPVPRERVAEAVSSLVNDWEGLGIVLAQEADALPHLQQAFAAAEKPDDKLRYAHILGMLGDATGADVLLKSVEAAEWDQGWSFKGMGQFGMSVSPVDSHIIALGRTRDPRALDVIVSKMSRLDTHSEFSHHRAVAMALETLADPRAAKPLADLLAKPGLMGHAYTNIDTAATGAGTGDPNIQRDRSLRELILARALFRCGDYQGIGEGILREYARDLRGHHARHANAVLREKEGA